MQIILICATARSGSTTLQRLINTIPNSNICGENWGAIINLLEFYANSQKTSSMLPTDGNRLLKYDEYIEQSIKPCFYNTFDLLSIKDTVKDLIIKYLSSNDNDNIIGFKEVRWYEKTHLINTFIELFPNTKIICHIRNDIENQSKSGWWKNDKYAKKHIVGYNYELIQFYNKNKNVCYFSTFENLFNYDELTKLFTFIGFTIDKKIYDDIMLNSLESN